MTNVTSRLSLLAAILCLSLAVEAQVMNPYSSTFEIDLNGAADPQLVLKREVTTTVTGTGDGTPNIGGGEVGNPVTTTTTTDYQWSISAGEGGLSLSSVATNGNTTEALRLGSNAAFFSGNNLMVGNTLSLSGNTMFLKDRRFIISDWNDENQFEVTASGAVTARKLNVTLAPIPDYVFEPDYELMTLAEVEAFIKEHGHLPNIKSAAMYEQIGSIDLAELELQLLEKVEELTLHSIEMKKEVHALQAELEELRKEIANK